MLLSDSMWNNNYITSLPISATQILNIEIQDQVADRYRDLMSQTIWLQKLEGIIKIMQEHVHVSIKLNHYFLY